MSRPLLLADTPRGTALGPTSFARHLELPRNDGHRAAATQVSHPLSRVTLAMTSSAACHPAALLQQRRVLLSPRLGPRCPAVR